MTADRSFADGTFMDERPTAYIRDVEGYLNNGSPLQWEIIWSPHNDRVNISTWPLTGDVFLRMADALRDMQAEHRWRGKLGGID